MKVSNTENNNNISYFSTTVEK